MDDNAFCDLAVDWLTIEEKGKDKKRAIGLVWLTILLDDTPTKIDAYVAELAARTTFSEIGILSMLEKSARAYLKHTTFRNINRIAHHEEDT